MKIKKYVASTMSEAMKAIRNELGEQAVILNSKIIYNGGFLGLFKKKNIEVIAAIDPKPDQKLETKVSKASRSSDEDILQKSVQQQTFYDYDHLAKEVKQLKNQLNSISSSYKSVNLKDYPQNIQEELIPLLHQELEEKWVIEIAKSLNEKWRKSDANVSKLQLKEWKREWFYQKLDNLSFGSIDYDKRYIHLVGPTGVGKTTTLAKLAAEAVLVHKKKIAFITSDTYRIAAIEQLKTYANLLSVPVEVVYKREDFQKAIDQFRAFDLIFIDTAGRNYRDFQFVKDLKDLIYLDHQELVSETLLVLSLTSKQKDMEEVTNQFRSYGIEKFIFTKMDETSTVGGMMNLILNHQKGAAYITNGQGVPEDIHEANKRFVVDQILEDISI
ncbi:flagellar biosynthesis protein FlhF [Rossellomorea sp. BNER]|uniref:flagellar biosynthesis protein FlhF n=1 Tax=Rossellomorea sp. BNER TaxID=2962031 RepID=UPI003AF278B0|nr:flagellar biosynthesis protein FlhF [Rossellomorea sp. BNER]